MREVKRVSTIMRAIGIVLLILSIVLVLYATATSVKDWNLVKGKLQTLDVTSNLVDRMNFNHDYFMGLRSARDTTQLPPVQRAAETLKQFDSILQRGKAGEAARDQNIADTSFAYLNDRSEGGFDLDAFLENYEKLEGGKDQAEINGIFDTLNALATPPLKSGKVLPNLKVASVAPWFEARYAEWQALHGEAAGSYLDFMLTFQRLILAKGDVKNAQTFAETIPFETYAAELAMTQSETGRERLELFTDLFADTARKVKAGELPGFEGFFEAEYEKIKAQFPASGTPSYATFLMNALSGLDTNPEVKAVNPWSFDGSYNSLYARLRSLVPEQKANTMEQFGLDFSRSLVQNSDDRRAVPLTTLIWLLAAKALAIGLIGILLIVGASLLSRYATAAIIKRREYVEKADEADVLLRVNNLSQYFKSGDFVNKAVDDVSFYIKKGEVFGLVGESGCGKTTTGRTIINLYDPTGGDVYFKGLRISSTKNGAPVMRYQLDKEYDAEVKALKAKAEDDKKKAPENASQIERETAEKIDALGVKHKARMEQVTAHAFESEEEKSKCTMLYRDQLKEELTAKYEQDIKGLSGAALEERTARYKAELDMAKDENVMTKIQMIFQDPIASINPRMTVREIIAEGLIIRGMKDKKLINDKVYEMLDLVGLVPEHADRYPHEFSGGQRQRIGIARAIVLEPELIIADEPISALDVSIQAQIINLLNDLRSRMGLTIMFIAHNLSVVKYFSDRIAVMYYGKIVEMAPSEELFRHPLHPYTKSLLSAIPYPDPYYEKQRKRISYEPILEHDYSVDKPELVEITPGHFILGNQAELAKYRLEVKK